MWYIVTVPTLELVYLLLFIYITFFQSCHSLILFEPYGKDACFFHCCTELRLCDAELPQSNFPEQAWCQILDRNRDKLFIGVCYRTPTDSIFDINTHSALTELLSEFGSSDRHFLLMGDFNYPLPRWPPQLASDGLSGQAKEFCHCLEDNFLVQHVTTPTMEVNIG